MCQKCVHGGKGYTRVTISGEGLDIIPDFNVGLVPNVGIVVGNRETLVIDPGLGRRNGEAVLREVAKVSKPFRKPDLIR